MRIGVDVDDVLADFSSPLVSYLNAIYGTSFAYDAMHSPYFERVWKIPSVTMKTHLNDFVATHIYALEPCRGASDSLASLVDAGHELHVVTARAHSIKDQTIRWIDGHFKGVFVECHLTNQYAEGPKTTKPDVCSNEGIELIIDDNLEHVYSCLRKSVKVVLFGQPWNKMIRPHNTIVRADGWKGVLPAVELLGQR